MVNACCTTNTLCSLRKTMLLALLLLVTTGCTMAPTYYRPEAPIPSQYGYTVPGTNGNALPGWQQFFTDPALQRLIQTALVNNRDLRIALLNIERTRQQYRIQQADLLPTIGAAAQEDSMRVSKDMSMLGYSNLTRTYSASLGFSDYELDLFGRVRSLTDQAIETHYSIEQDAKTAQTSLIAEVAAMYFQLVADRESLALMQATCDNRQQHYNLVDQRFAAGIASALEQGQAKVGLEESKGMLIRAQTKVEQDQNYLTLLLGTAIPADLPKHTALSNVVSLPDVPAGLPSDLMERRPDIQAAEHRLKASNANIGAARANFFPKITLTGSLGSITSDYTNLLHGSAAGWNFLPRVSIPLFDTGRNISILGVATEEKKIAIATYEKAIQSAFREVADALVQRNYMSELLTAEESRVKAAGTVFSHAEARYKSGVDSHIVLLDAQRMYLAAQQNLISTRLLRESNALSLYKALGGGWK